MSNNKCWYETTINFEGAFNKNWNLPEIKPGEWSTKEGIWRAKTHQVFSTDWLKYAKSLELSLLGTTLLFYRRPFYFAQRAHVDVQPESCSVNYIIGGKNSQMIWYEKTNITQERDVLTSVAETPYLSWPVSELKEIERTTISNTKITLCRVDIPHAIIVGDEERWCISMRLSGNIFYNWDDTVDFFRKKNLLIE